MTYSGSLVASIGGLFANATGSGQTALVGLIVAIAGLCTAVGGIVTSLAKLWFEDRANGRAAMLARHNLADRLNAALLQIHALEAAVARDATARAARIGDNSDRIDRLEAARPETGPAPECP